MREFVKPKVVVSKCLGFAACRYNGATIRDDFVQSLEPFVEFITTCPEVEIDLGIPRDPIRVVLMDEEPHLIQSSTGLDVSDKMNEFTASFLATVADADGFILKSRSPSCGIKDVKIYPRLGKASPVGKSHGFFGGAVLTRFPQLPIEDEGRLTNFRIREHFLTQLFTIANFREVKKSRKMKDLVQLHAENKYLLMAYNQKEMRIMGKIVANHDKKLVDEVFHVYEEHLLTALHRPPRHTSNINVLMHGLGYFSDELSAEEKAFFLDSLEQYRAAKVPLSVCLAVLRSWIIRFDEGYLKQQTFFAPYPPELVEITDSGKGRKL